MQTSAVGSILEAISVLDPDDQLFVTEVLNKRMIEIRRNQILARAKESEENYKNGNTQTVTVAELMMLSSDDDWIDSKRVIFTDFKKVAQKTPRTRKSISTKTYALYRWAVSSFIENT